MPVIWGQQEAYLVKQLHDYRSGDRGHPLMGSIAKGLKQEDLRKIAHYFAGKTWPQGNGNASAPEPQGIVACKICHQPKFEGGLPAPRLAGLSYDYLIAQMNNFASDTRAKQSRHAEIHESALAERAGGHREVPVGVVGAT